MSTEYGITRTKAEEKLAQVLRKEHINFKQNHLLEGYEVDFWIAEAGLAIEVDGFTHLSNRKSGSDRIKDQKLHDKGYMVIRYENRQIHNNVNQCINEIKSLISTIIKYRINKEEFVNSDWKKTLKSIRQKIETSEVQKRDPLNLEDYFLSIDQESD